MIVPKLPTRHRSSSFVRISFLIYWLLIIYASWYPFTGWRDLGISPFAFLSARLPYYWTVFDVWVNVAGYLPLGLLAVLVLPRRLHFVIAIVLATLFGVLNSGVMEAVQTYLPTRVSDKLDFLTNSAGTLIGAVIGVQLRSWLDADSKILRLREYWFNRDASRGMVIVALWPCAQLTPLSHLFGFGQLSTMTSTWLSTWFEQPISISGWITNDAQLSVAQYWLVESIITACGLIGAGLMLLIVLRKQAPKFVLVSLLLAATLLIKTMASALLFTPENALVWLTPGALTGLLIGILLLAALSFSPHQVQRWLAVLALMINLFVVNVIPDNPYYMATLQTWNLGKFLNFYGVSQFLALLWPFFALWFLLHPMQSMKSNPKPPLKQ